MRKLLEKKSIDEDRKSLLVLYTFSILTFALFILTRVSERSFFNLGFFIEFVFIFAVLRFYARAHINKNYAFWGLSLIMGIYLIMNIMQYTFIHYNIFILYVAFLASIFMGINCYVISSP